MHKGTKAFTLIEMLVSVALLGLVLAGLYSMLDRQRRSNADIVGYLENSSAKNLVASVLYRDLLYSDGNISIVEGEFDRVCIGATKNSLYGLGEAEVCWLVEKDGTTLVRLEGNAYTLPLSHESRVAVDRVMGPMKLFDLSYAKGRLLVLMQKEGDVAYTFLLRGIYKAPKSSNRKRAGRRRRKRGERAPGHPSQKAAAQVSEKR